jgi:hypothetical protein
MICSEKKLHMPRMKIFGTKNKKNIKNKFKNKSKNLIKRSKD